MAGDVQTTMYFLARKEKYKTEKPYASRYDPEGAFPASNIEPTAYNVKIQNMRPLVQKLCYEQTGFQFAEIHSQMKYEDYADRDKIRKIHVPEVETLLKNVMEVPQVYLLDFVVHSPTRCCRKPDENVNRCGDVTQPSPLQLATPTSTYSRAHGCI